MANDTDYIGGILRGDTKTINQVYQNFFPAIADMVRNLHGKQQDAEDVFQEGLMAVFKMAKSPEFKLTSKFFTLFFKVCKNIWLNKLRKKQPHEVTFDDELRSIIKEEVVQEFITNEQYFLFRKHFFRLGSDCQRVLGLYFRGASMQKIREQMNYGSIGYAKKRKLVCKKKLIERIRKDPDFKDLND